MIINYPITDYIKQSILTTKGDMVVEGTTDPERLAAAAVDLYLKAQGAGATPIYEALALRNTGIKIGNYSRSIPGDEVITGVGFKPSCIIFIARDGDTANSNLSWGVSDGSTDMAVLLLNDGTSVMTITIYSTYIQVSSGNNLKGVVSAMGSDGFTVTYTETGTASMDVIYLALP